MTVRKTIRLWLVLTLLAGAGAAADAAAVTCTSTAAGGNWNATGTWTGCAGGNGTVANTPGSADTAIIATTGAGTVTVNVTVTVGAVTVNSAATLTQSSGLTVTGALNVAGTLTSTNTLAIGGAANVTGTLNITSTTGTRTFTGAVTITGGTWSNSANEPVTFRNGLLFNGGTFSAGTGVHTFAINNQAIGGTSTLSIPSVTVTGITLTNNGTLTVATALAGTGTLINGANATLNVGMSAVGITTLTASATGNTVNYTRAGTQTVEPTTGSTYFNLTLSGTSAKTLPGALTISGDFSISGTASTTAAGVLAVSGDFSIGAGTTFGGSTFTHSVAGDFSNSGTFTASTSTMTFTGGAAQTLGGTVATTFNNLLINKSANNVSIVCGTPSPTVSATLTLTSGKIVTSGTSPGCSTACGSQVPIIVGTAGTIAGGSSSSYVQGALRKLFAAAGTLNFRATAGQDEFPVGDTANYTPVEITAGGTSTAGNVTVCVTGTEHPQVTTPPVATGGIDAAKSVNRYWSLATSGINTASGAGAVLVDATFKFVAADVDAGANTSNFVVEDWDGTKWSPTTLVTAAATRTRAQNIDLTGATNEVAIGEPLSGVTGLPGNFNAFDTATPAGAVLGMIQTKQSGVAFSLRLVRLNAARNGLDATYTQAGVTVELLDSSDNTGLLSATTGCRPIGAAAGQWHVIAGTTQTVAFNAGLVATVTFTVANAFRDVRVHVVKTGTGAGEGCSTDRFAIRPQSLTVTAHDATWETAGTARTLANLAVSGGTVHKASTAAAASPRPFTLRATPAPVGATNYDGNPSVVSGFPSCAGLGALCTTAGTLIFTGAWTSVGSGVRDNATAHYSEAGSFNLRLEDSGYASVDSVDGTPAATRTVPPAATAQIGRFVPDYFVVTPNNTPQFQTFGSACVSRSFTYFGQPFGYVTAPQALVTAQNAGGGTTTNYGGSLWKITTAAPSDVTQTYSDGGVGPGIDTSAATNLPAVAQLANGTGTVTVSSSDKLSYVRSTALPQPPFSASISLTVSVRDDSEADGQILTTTATPFSAIAFDAGNLVRYGRLRLENAHGSQLIALPVSIQTQFWNGTGFVTNTLDDCTAIPLANITFGNYQSNLVAGDTTATIGGAFTAGIGTLRLSAPGSAKRGSVDVTANLTAAGLTYLQGAWSGTSYINNPTARATFGIYRNTDQMIYQRENF